eukprot:scaffold65822_cov14-Prasinocladus_malaysianus.AAC.1
MLLIRSPFLKLSPATTTPTRTSKALRPDQSHLQRSPRARRIVIHINKSQDGSDRCFMHLTMTQIPPQKLAPSQPWHNDAPTQSKSQPIAQSPSSPMISRAKSWSAENVELNNKRADSPGCQLKADIRQAALCRPFSSNPEALAVDQASHPTLAPIKVSLPPNLAANPKGFHISSPAGSANSAASSPGTVRLTPSAPAQLLP